MFLRLVARFFYIIHTILVNNLGAKLEKKYMESLGGEKYLFFLGKWHFRVYICGAILK